MKEVSREQSFQLMSVFQCNADWSKVPSDTAQRLIDDPGGSGLEFTRFLMNCGRVVSNEPSIISINRTTPFNPAKFLGEGWSIWKGPIDGDGLSGEEEQDNRSLALTELDLSNIRFEICLQKGENYITGEEKLKRLKKADFIRLDASIFLTLRQNQHLVPDCWKEKTNGNTTFIFFDGTTLRGPFGYRRTLYLYFGDGRWGWNYYWLVSARGSGSPSAVLAS